MIFETLKRAVKISSRNLTDSDAENKVGINSRDVEIKCIFDIF